MKVTFVRHPQTTWNEQRLFQGEQEGDISESGKLDTIEFVKKTRDNKIDIIYCADNKRCKYLANKLIESHPNAKIIIDSRINERSFGIYEGTSEVDMSKTTNFETNDFDKRFKWKPTGGESLEDVSVRVNNFLIDLKKEQKTKTAFVVTSGGVIKTVSYILGIKTLKEAMMLKMKNLEMLQYPYAPR